MALTLKKSVVLPGGYEGYTRAWPNHRRLSPLIYSKGVNVEILVVGGEKCSLLQKTLA